MASGWGALLVGSEIPDGFEMEKLHPVVPRFYMILSLFFN
jgi:hypothetical protein